MPKSRPLPMDIIGAPFTTAEALHAEVSPATLRGPRVRTVARGVHVSAQTEDSLDQRVRGLLRVLPGPVVADCSTALRLAGIEIGDPGVLHFTTTAGHGTRRSGVRLHRSSSLPPADHGVARPVAALVAAAHELSLVELVTVGDQLIHQRRSSIEHVQSALSAASGRSCRRCHRAGELVRAEVESQRETRLRLLIVLGGLPEPECNVKLGTEYVFLGRVDLYYRSWKIVIEYEGDHHRSDPRQWEKDVARYEALAAEGYLVIRITKTAMRRPDIVLDRIYRALRGRGYTGAAPRTTADWRAAFGVPRHPAVR